MTELHIDLVRWKYADGHEIERITPVDAEDTEAAAAKVRRDHVDPTSQGRREITVVEIAKL